ncbi:MAG TPA: hypothetical protein VNH44_09380 [Micropepsaceae bacterium]|nr:hypothetical protein [Micropepsaceae bacterium]
MAIRSTEFVAAVASILAPVIDDQATKYVSAIVSEDVAKQEWGQAFIYIVAAVITVLIFVSLIWLINRTWKDAFKKFSFLRKLRFGDRYIEGWWIDHTADHNDAFSSRAAIKISYDEDGVPSVFGKAYVEATRNSYTFGSRLVSSAERDIEFIYDVTGPDIPSGRAHGYARYTFPQGVGRPIFYQGFFIDAGRPVPLNVEGKKVTDRKLIADLNASNGNAIVDYHP